MEQWREQTEKYRGEVFSVWSGEADRDDGTVVTRDVVRHQGSVAVVALLDSSVVLVRQFRIAVGKEVLEIPAGRIEQGEDPDSAAKRELEEETGYRSSRLEPGPSYYSSVGFLDERVQIFFAFDLVKTERAPEPDERVSLALMPITEVEQRLSSKDFDDSKTIIGLRELLMYLKKPDPIVDVKTLYTWYSDENHKYNTLIWQFPAAIVALNILAFEKIGSSAWLLLAMWLINTVLLSCVAKHAYHQKCFTSALQSINDVIRKRHPELDVVSFPEDGMYFFFRRFKAAWFLVAALALFNQVYLALAVWRLLS